MTITELLLSVAITLTGIVTWKLVARSATERGHPERLSNAGGALVGVIVGILALVATAPAPVLVSEPASPTEPPALAARAEPAERPVPLIEPAIAVAAEAPPAAPSPEPTVAPAAPSEDPARLAFCKTRNSRADIERRARNKFGSASDRLEPGEELVLEAATAVAIRSDAAARRGATGIDGTVLASGTRIKVQQRFGRPGGWVWYQIYVADADAWRYTTSRELAWLNRSSRGRQHDRAKRQWIDAEVAKARDPELEERAVREQWRCDGAEHTHRS